MTSIYDIPRRDVEIFLLANDRNIKGNDEDYDIALTLLGNTKARGHTTSIIEWMIAHNLLIMNVNVPVYTITEINNMSQSEINQLAKLLTMKGNNINNIKNILRYLNKLQDDDETNKLLPEITDIIFKNLNDLEIQDIDISKLKYYDVINLLKTHRNKALIRYIIYSNMEEIILINLFGKKFTIKVETKGYDIPDTWMNDLVNFVINLAEIKEIELAKIAIALINNHNIMETGVSFNYHFIEKLVYEVKNLEILETFLDIMGDDIFLDTFNVIIIRDYLQKTRINFFLENLVKLEKYDLLVRSIQILIDKDYTGNAKVIKKILLEIKKAIPFKKDALIIRYINIIGTMSILNTVKSGNNITNARNLGNFNRLIKEAKINTI